MMQSFLLILLFNFIIKTIKVYTKNKIKINIALHWRQSFAEIDKHQEQKTLSSSATFKTLRNTTHIYSGGTFQTMQISNQFNI